MRQKFHIPNLRVVIKKVAKECPLCKLRKAVPHPPKMAVLPVVRLTPNIKPFTHTGIDYFGPLQVKQRRSLVKRWVALFTCLTIRAVHVEVVHSLTTNSCILAIRRFIARRGPPSTIYSDQGTNFKGARNILLEQLQPIHEKCAITFTNASTQWYLNPPATPHMGGAWERMVRSIKIAMEAVANHAQNPCDEVLETVVLEAEAIVNSRPLTYVPLDSAETEALTPNHFLVIGDQAVTQPMSETLLSGSVLRDSWELTRRLVDIFWTRWIKEYLPTLTRRSKWFEATKPLQPGDVVIIVDEKKRNGWIRGRVLEVIPASDGEVRRAYVRTPNGVGLYSAVRLARLDIKDSRKDKVSTIPEHHEGGNVGEAPRKLDENEM
ncbi:uncharacterized protein LOC129753945 [Uranotaenia lowii]|uniref:uncharacterized protein LOC129753945 n=1 Tax=Uranotaenia lowii TaxID=190385 RepID=UPI00247AB4FA|nr:uncharacterized protein LOC129753945 [Uranotaenia lowii]